MIRVVFVQAAQPNPKKGCHPPDQFDFGLPTERTAGGTATGIWGIQPVERDDSARQTPGVRRWYTPRAGVCWEERGPDRGPTAAEQPNP